MVDLQIPDIEPIPGIDITRMSENDLDQVIALAIGVTEIQTGTSADQFWSRQTLEGWINADDGVLLVAKEGEQVVGYSISSVIKSAHDAIINVIEVHPDHQKKGIASNLIVQTLIELKSIGCNHVKCDIKPDNIPSQELFSRFGFEMGESFIYAERMIYGD
ncbi:MAG: acetyltransferase [candidate division WS6 bacterium GW2011_GWA2_37_6]|uniref:Acetyltransferase n=1 Tax=candidate division WS6 bacterium GW2011_GWA2_37_6 TaxID=1619087 RepID=A0A0G0K4V1_9BACT|nr:MAG: acetyltransferase [candidate division WS6 bacterium GW2011_GWA2_37_6]